MVSCSGVPDDCVFVVPLVSISIIFLLPVSMILAFLDFDFLILKFYSVSTPGVFAL